MAKGATRQRDTSERGKMTPEQRAQLAKAIEGANKLRAEICERYGGPFYPSSGEVISEMRDERSHALE